MQKEDKKSDRIPVSQKTRIRLKKFYVLKNLRNYDVAINLLLDKDENKDKDNPQSSPLTPSQDQDH